MVNQHSNDTFNGMQDLGGLDYVRFILDGIDSDPVLTVLAQYRQTGRRGYPIASLWRAFLVGRILGMPSVNALIRRLHENPELRLICGLSRMPHRTTFLRFFHRLARHRGEVDACIATLTEKIAADLPGFGTKVAVDSTVVPTHGNPNRRHKRPADADADWTDDFDLKDAEASWTKKNSARAYGSDGKVWFYGYKYHLLCDVTYDIPMVGYVTTAKQNDSPTLKPLMELASETHAWFAPQYVIADRGYDSVANHRQVLKYKALPIIHIIDRKKKETELRNKIFADIYTIKGVPTCVGMQEMEFVRTDPEKGHLYRCPLEGCGLKERKGVVHCQDTFWVGPDEWAKNPRIAGQVRRGSDKWETNYALRQGIERVFKSMKQSRSLDSHCFMGEAKVGLHVALSALAYQATIWANCGPAILSISAGWCRGWRRDLITGGQRQDWSPRPTRDRAGVATSRRVAPQCQAPGGTLSGRRR